VFVKRDTVSKKCLITACLILLIDLSIFQELYLSFHQHNLLLQVQDVLFLEVFGDLILSLFLSFLLLHLMTAFKVGIPFELLVTWGT